MLLDAVWADIIFQTTALKNKMQNDPFAECCSAGENYL